MIQSRNCRATILFVLLAAACVYATRVRSAAAQTPSINDVDLWIVQLGDDSYTVRQGAADRLAAGGLPARAALARVVDGPDPEIRAAARRLVVLIDDTEFNRRLAEFADDVDGQRGVMLPGWKEFGELVGRDQAARVLFVDMQREEAALLFRTFDASAANGEIAWEEQVERLIRARMFDRSSGIAAPLGSCATLLFLGAMPDSNLSDAGAQGLARLTQIPPLREALASGQPDNALRRLVSAWIIHCPNRSGPVLSQRLTIMLQQQLAEALPLALEIIEPDPKYMMVSPSLQVMAILAVGKLGSEKNVADLEPLLDDRSEVRTTQPVNTLADGSASIQVRDVALAALLHLTDQEPLTYGFLHARTHPPSLFDVRSLSMQNDQRRAAAIEQWRAWRAQHKLRAPRPASS